MVVGVEFASLVELTEDIDDAAGKEFAVDRPERIGSERQRVPRDLMRKLILLIVKSIPRSRLSKAGRTGGCGRKSMDPKWIWPSMVVELLLGEEGAVEFMTTMPRFRTDGVYFSFSCPVNYVL
jgi:hypothetical protein